MNTDELNTDQVILEAAEKVAVCDAAFGGEGVPAEALLLPEEVPGGMVICLGRAAGPGGGACPVFCFLCFPAGAAGAGTGISDGGVYFMRCLTSEGADTVFCFCERARDGARAGIPSGEVPPAAGFSVRGRGGDTVIMPSEVFVKMLRRRGARLASEAASKIASMYTGKSGG